MSAPRPDGREISTSASVCASRRAPSCASESRREGLDGSARANEGRARASLSARALDLLGEAKRARTGDFVFPGSGAGRSPSVMLPFGLSRLGGKRNPFPPRGRRGPARPRHRRRGGAGLPAGRRARKAAGAHGGVGAFPRAEHSRQCRETFRRADSAWNGIPKPSATRGAASPLATFRRPNETGRRVRAVE